MRPGQFPAVIANGGRPAVAEVIVAHPVAGIDLSHRVLEVGPVSGHDVEEAIGGILGIPRATPFSHRLFDELAVRYVGHRARPAHGLSGVVAAADAANDVYVGGQFERQRRAVCAEIFRRTMVGALATRVDWWRRARAGELARLAGPVSVWIFPLCALLVAPIILCFAQLSSCFRGTGGPILYAASAFGPMAGFQVGCRGCGSAFGGGSGFVGNVLIFQRILFVLHG